MTNNRGSWSSWGSVRRTVAVVGAMLTSIVACSSSSSSDGAGAGATLSDGSLGSSCTSSCQTGFQCATGAGVPGGYCTKGCASEADCAPGGHCYNTSSGPACLRGCTGAAECRDGYTCAGDPAGTVCQPAGSGAGGAGTGGGTGAGAGTGTGAGTGAGAGPGGGTDCIDNATLTGGYWQKTSGGSLEQILFKADGTTDQSYYVAGFDNTWYTGTWTLACPTLSTTINTGKPHTFTVQPSQLTDETGTAWTRCTPISSGTCF